MLSPLGWLEAAVLLVTWSQGRAFQDDIFPFSFAEISEGHLKYSEHEVVFPREVTHKESDFPRYRVKRNVPPVEPVRQFSLKAAEGELRMELMPQRELLAPGFQVYHRGGGESTLQKGAEEMSACLYWGRLRHRPESSVALNLCGGMTGLIKTEKAEYLIEPLSREARHSPGAVEKPHILRKRSLDERETRERSHKQTHFCGKKRRYMPHKPRRRDHWLPDEFAGVDDQPTKANRTKRWAPDSSLRYHRRHRRSVETLVVADREMVKKHGTENVTTYLLTVFNMVSMLYQDSSIGGNVSVILVGIVLLEGDEPGLSLSHSAETSLSSFCQWQSTIHTTSGQQHDHAVLVTGLDICSWKDEPCDTLGFAPISGMCSKYRSCTVNEDSGLALAFTVAHEIGHNFGMVHDGQSSSKCRKGQGTIMSASLSGLDTSALWSECSRKDLARFLESPRSFCLKNEPRFPGELQFPSHLPGQVYDADMQCRLQFGNKSKLCTHYPRKNEVCRSLWCQRSGRECETKFLPAAEGTPCGEHKWCRKGVCIDRGLEILKNVDGEWSKFSDWSNCSRTCGGGLRIRKRFCDSPAPQNGGRECKGEDTEYQICGTQDCEEDNFEFGDQCSTFDKRTVKGKFYRWKPYGKDLGGLSRCRIYCVPDEKDMYLVLSTKLRDGTSCSGNYSGVCIDGECRNVGCDGQIDSSVMPDYCGVCNGNNSTCKTVKGKFRATNLTAGYHEVVQIPSNSRHLHISEETESPSYLALTEVSGFHKLNGNGAADWPGRYKAAGTIFSYRRWPGKPESLVAKGPTTDQLIVQILIQDSEDTVVNYRFVVSSTGYEWKYSNTSCSKACGNGIYMSKPSCRDLSGSVVPDNYCNSPKPITLTFPCKGAICPSASWQLGEWSLCSSSCNASQQHRSAFCTDGTKKVTRSFCSSLPPPQLMRDCPENCSHTWFTGMWSKCRGSCSSGFQIRSVTCRQSIDGRADSFSNCKNSFQPPHIRKCRNDNCSLGAKAENFWIAGEWSKCSAECGTGNRNRAVSCMRKSVGSLMPSSSCDPNSRPESNQTCTSDNCNELHTQGCENSYEWCPISTNPRLCQLKFYATNCCRTCTDILKNTL